MPKYSHAYSLGFELISDSETGADVTPKMIREAVHRRLTQTDDLEIMEAVGEPFDTEELD